MTKKILIAYYSWSGTTARLAKKLQAALGEDVYNMSIPTDTFSADMYETSAIAQKQLASGSLPRLTVAVPDLSQYDLVLVGGPVWSGAPATPVRSFLKEIAGSIVPLAPFYTHTGSADDYEQEFAALAGQRQIFKGMGVVGAHIADADIQVASWLEQF
jgi:flavodoxin